MKASDKRVLWLAAGAFLILAAGSAGQNPAPSQPALQSSTKSAANPQTQKAAPTPAPLEVPQLKFEKYKLQNGLLVILSEDHRLPTIAATLWYHARPAHDLPARTGSAHLSAHMSFARSPPPPERPH